MKQKLNAYLPIWFILMVPPLVLVMLCYNFISAGIGLLLTLFMIKKKDAFTKYSKNIWKVWFTALVMDIVALITLLLPELFHKVDFVKENLIYPLEHNPYSNILSFIYIALVFVIVFVVGKMMIKKYVVSKMNLDKKIEKTANLLITILIIPYLFFIPSTYFINNERGSIEDYRGTLMSEKSDIVIIMKYLNVTKYINSYILDTHAEPYSINLYLDTIDLNQYLYFEQDAAVLLSLVKDVNEVVFIMDGNRYTYTINSINKIFKDVKKKSLNEINKRYSDSKFKNYIYYGNIAGYDIFDTSDYCEEELKELFVYNDEKYFISCTSVDKIMFYSSKESFSLKEAIEQEKLDKEIILSTHLNITKK